MPYIPHTKSETTEMLKTIGIESIEDLFSEIPKELRNASLEAIPSGLTAMEATRLFTSLAQRDAYAMNFIGAGAYEHHIPAAVWAIATRGEFLTAYTPYQPEASQGSLQLIYEYQSMMASLMGLDVSNASLYDGATSLTEAILMAARISKHKQTKILLPRSLHPYYRDTIQTIVQVQGIQLIELPFDATTGVTSIDALESYAQEQISALVIPMPNFFGCIEDVDALTTWARAHKILVIAVVNPMSMSLLKEPGAWGGGGVDIACGEGQPLGIPLCSGGPYFGFLCCKKEHVRQMPGRIVGKTVDHQGRTGFVLTLQAREQHIRRAKATSNICTNQGLMVTAATIYMSLLGADGLRDVAMAAHQNTQKLAQHLTQIPGIRLNFTGHFFHECVIQLPASMSASDILRKMQEEGIEAGFALESNYPELKNCILFCVTETKTDEDLVRYAEKFKQFVMTHD